MHTEGKKNNQSRTKSAPKKEKKTWLCEERVLKKRKACPRLPRLHDKHKNSQQNGALKREAKKNMRARALAYQQHTKKRGAGDVAAGGGRRRRNDDTSRD